MTLGTPFPPTICEIGTGEVFDAAATASSRALRPKWGLVRDLLTYVPNSDGWGVEMF